MIYLTNILKDFRNAIPAEMLIYCQKCNILYDILIIAVRKIKTDVGNEKLRLGVERLFHFFLVFPLVKTSGYQRNGNCVPCI